MHLMGIEVRDLGGRAEIALVGELDTTGCGMLRSCVEALHPSVGTVVIDVSDITFIDGAGAGELLQLREDLEVQLRHLEVVAAGGEAELVLDLMGAAEILRSTRLQA